MIMCKIDDFIDVTSRYIAELLDLRADIRPVEKDVLHTFPANITAGYTFCTANLLGHDVVLLYTNILRIRSMPKSGKTMRSAVYSK